MQTVELEKNADTRSDRLGLRSATQCMTVNATGEKKAIAMQAGIGCEPETESVRIAGDSYHIDSTIAMGQSMVDHMHIVRSIARQIQKRLPQHVELEELISAGMLGLVDAFSKFDSERQQHFPSYAQFRIRGAILDSLRSIDWAPRILRRKGREVEVAIGIVTKREGKHATEEQIAAELKINLRDYQQLLGELKGLEIGSLHVKHSEDSSEDELAYIAGPPNADPLFQCLQGEMRQRLADAVTALPELERLVMTLHYFEELTRKEIGVMLGLAEARVSQIHSSAVLHLRSRLASLTEPHSKANSLRRNKKRSLQLSTIRKSPTGVALFKTPNYPRRLRPGSQ